MVGLAQFLKAASTKTGRLLSRNKASTVDRGASVGGVECGEKSVFPGRAYIAP